MNKDKAIVIFSGGPDSTAAALWAINQGYEVELLTFQFKNEDSYGEIKASMDIAQALKLKHKIVDFKSPLHMFTHRIRPMMHSGIREKESEEQASPYLLPYGSGIILSFASSYAIDAGIKNIVWGATRDDRKDNPSYSVDFATELASLISKTTGKSITIHTPLHAKHKYQVVGSVIDQSDLFHKTWTCIEEGPTQCGKCVACITRRLAVDIAKKKDLTPYISPTYNSSLSAQDIQDIPSMSQEDRDELLGDIKKTC
jgi:7-cyano-7-deazaguanine synthase